MSSVVLAAPRTRAHRSAVATDAVVVVALGLLCAAIAALTWSAWGSLGQDTGYDLVAGARVAHGQVPYVDFVYYYGPLAPYALGLATWVGGAGVGPALALGLVISLAIIGLTYAVARTFCAPLPAGLAAAIVAAVAFAPTNFSFVLPHTETATLGIVCLLVVVLGLRRYETSALASWLLVAGAAGGVAALTRPDAELAFLGGSLVWLVARARGGRTVGRELVLLAAPALAIPAVVYGAFMSRISLHRLVFDNLYPVDALRAAGNHIVRLHAPLTAASFLRLGERTVLYALGTVALVAVGLLLERRPAFRIVAACLVAVVAAAAILRPETTRYYLAFAYEWVPLGALAALGYLLYRRRTDGVAELGVLVVLAALSYDTFTLQAANVQPSVYAAPFVALLLVRLHVVELGRSPAVRVLACSWLAFLAAAGIGLAVKDARAEVTVRGPGGALAAPRAQAPVYRAALATIESQTKRGDAILVAPQLSALYVLAERTDPISQISLLPGALASPGAEQEAIASIEQAHVRLILIDRHEFTEYGHSSFGDSFDRTLAAWIKRRYAHVATLGSGPAAQHVLDVLRLRRTT